MLTNYSTNIYNRYEKKYILFKKFCKRNYIYIFAIVKDTKLNHENTKIIK